MSIRVSVNGLLYERSTASASRAVSSVTNAELGARDSRTHLKVLTLGAIMAHAQYGCHVTPL